MHPSSVEAIGKSLENLIVGFNDAYDKTQSGLQNSEASRKANSEIITRIQRNVIGLEKQLRSITNNFVDIGKNSSTTAKESPESEIIVDVEGPSGSSTFTLFDSILNGAIPLETVNQTNWADISSTSNSDEASNNVKAPASIQKPKINVTKTTSKKSKRSKKVKKNKYVPPNLDSSDSDEAHLNNRNTVSASDSKLKNKSQTNFNTDSNIKYKCSLNLDGQILLILKKTEES